MDIYALTQTKGGVSKTTNVKILAFSKAFRKKYPRIGLVELDGQRALEDWLAQREDNEFSMEGVLYKALDTADEATFLSEFEDLCNNCDAVIIDCPGESKPGFATKFALKVADVIVIPFKPTEDEEQSFSLHVYPAILEAREEGAAQKVMIVPTRIQGQTATETIRKYLSSIFPEDLNIANNYIPFHDIFGDFSRDGMSLKNYAVSYRKNKRMTEKIKKMIDISEKVVKEIIKLGESK